MTIRKTTIKDIAPDAPEMIEDEPCPNRKCAICLSKATFRCHACNTWYCQDCDCDHVCQERPHA